MKFGVWLLHLTLICLLLIAFTKRHVLTTVTVILHCTNIHYNHLSYFKHRKTQQFPDLKRLSVGHSRIQYLLNNWDVLTESCNNKAMSKTESIQVVRTEGGGGGFCDKTPLVVQDYLGYKSTNDPLFKADSLMLKAAPLVDDLGVMDEADYVDLVEQYRDKADQTSLLAYTSSWGEANPNGSKDTTDDYLDQTKKVVMETEVLLRKIMGGLKLEVLPPSEKMRA